MTAIASAESPSGSSRPTVGIVVAVDESGSLSNEDLEAEKRAAAAVLNLPYSSIEISASGGLLGFSSDARPICPPAVADPLPALPLADTAGCVDQLRRGEDTNHASAIRMATEMLDGPSTKNADSKIMILMTDGKCDLGSRGPCDEQEVAAAVAAAKASRVQIWPVAFGEIDRGPMEKYANGGAGPNRRCSKAESPKLIERNDPDSLGLALLDVVRQSSCGVGVDSGLNSLRIRVNPLLSKLVLQVTDPDGAPGDPIIKDGNNALKLCEQRATPTPNVITCTFLNPSPAGDWYAEDEGTLIVALQQGSVTLRVEGCDAARPVPDQPRVSADAGREVAWSEVTPEDLSVTLAGIGGAGVASTLTRADQSAGIWQTAAVVDGAGSAGTLTPAGGSASLPWLTVSGDPCEFGGTAAVPVVDSKPSGPPWVLIALLLLVLLIIIVLLMLRTRKRRRLPNATIYLRNSSGVESIPTFVSGARRWNWDIDWNGPMLTQMMTVANTTVVREGS
ncbi:MAG: VWA domain-containing protein, partial [Actinobacteria bacterium]|nr:VWA domain-containing protein [Actinomycetota bacterium]